MFDLNAAIQSWCESVHEKGPERDAHIDELVDHMHCVVRAIIHQGQSPEDAFHLAVQQLGSPKELALENSKNQRGPLSPKGRGWLLIGVSLFFAVAIVVTGWIMGDHPQSDTATNLWIAVWFIPFTILSMPRREPCQS